MCLDMHKTLKCIEFIKRFSKTFLKNVYNNNVQILISKNILGSKGLQDTNGSPVMSLGQLQTGVVPRNSQLAFTPQEPSQGFTHFE